MTRPSLLTLWGLVWRLRLLRWRLAARQVLGGLYVLALWRVAHWAADRLNRRYPHRSQVRIVLVPHRLAPATVLPLRRCP